MAINEFISVEKVRLSITRRRGIGEVVILIHGMTDNAACWGRVGAELGGYYDLIAYDLRAHGQSDAPDTGYTLDDHARDLAGLVDQLGLGAVRIVGHSLGAEVAVKYAIDQPQTVTALFIADPPWHKDWEGTANARRQMAAKNWRQWIEHLQSLPLDEVIQIGRAETPHWSDEDIVVWAQSKHQFRLTGLESVLAYRENWQSLVARIKCPTTLALGDTRQGALVPLSLAQEAQNYSRHIRISHIEGAGHGIQRDNFRAFMAALKSSLRQ